MADKKYVNDINEILDFVLNDDSDLDVDLGNDTDDFSNTDSESEFDYNEYTGKYGPGTTHLLVYSTQ